MKTTTPDKRGFTLAEMLIVIAIIAILIAIAMPVFTSQLRSARLAADHANIRAAYTWAQSANLMGSADLDGDGTISDNEKNSALSSRTPVYFHRDGTISNVEGNNCYTLQVTAKGDECGESAGCGKDTHVQGKKITIVYTPPTAGNQNQGAWAVVLA